VRSPKAAPVARSPRPAVQHLGLKLGVFAALCLLPLAGACLLLSRGGSAWPLMAYGLVSLVTFLMYWQDKSRARQDARRTPENVLHAAELLGGWPGALLAQQAFRHKTRKVSYLVVLWGIVLVHEVVWVDYVVLGGRYLHQVF
jgi:uncharacterized membrane protein YsdA (DUF1294 family)